MSVLLLGDPSTTYSNNGSVHDGDTETYTHDALGTGVVTELRIPTRPTIDSTATTVVLGIYSNDAGLPGEILGAGSTSDIPAAGDDYVVTGLSIPLVEGERYHLAVLAMGGRVYYHYGEETDPNGAIGDSPPYTALPEPWSGDLGGIITNQVPFLALGELGSSETPVRSGFEIAITTHHDLETETPAQVVQWVRARLSAEIAFTKSDQRTGKVTISLFDGAAALFDSGANDYLYRLFIRLNGVPALWAPIKTSWDAEAGTVTLLAVDADRMQNHYVRDGDEAIDNGSSYAGEIPVDHRGVRLLRDAANNTPEQDARFVVPLGIRDGASSTTTARRVEVARGDQVFSDTTQLAQGAGAPDFSLDVLDVNDPDAYPDYMVLNCYDRQGTDRSAADGAVVLQCGYGLMNLDGFKLAPSTFVTHAHVLGDGGHPRVTRYHATSSRQRGVYVRWIATALKVSVTDTAALEAIAEAIIKAYGVPLHAYAITMKPDSLQAHRFLRDFGIGDTVKAGVKRGYLNREIAARIMAATVKETGRVRDTVTSLTVVPSLVNDEDIGGDEE